MGDYVKWFSTITSQVIRYIVLAHTYLEGTFPDFVSLFDENSGIIDMMSDNQKEVPVFRFMK